MDSVKFTELYCYSYTGIERVLLIYDSNWSRLLLNLSERVFRIYFAINNFVDFLNK